jgi:hypothetical protein
VERCNRCNAEADLLALARFADTETRHAEEFICEGCCTRVELALGRRIPDDLELMAFVLALSDAVDRLSVSRAVGVGVPSDL